MKSINNFIVFDTQTIKDAISIIQKNLSRCSIVLNEDRKVIGVFSEGDVLRAILQEIDLHVPVRKIVRPSFHYLNSYDFDQAFEIIKKHGITLLPVVDEAFKLVGVITLSEVLNQIEKVSCKNGN